jgi:energy-converting hydrogenase Eha subunit A
VAVEIFATPVVALGKADQLTPDAGRLCVARQLAQLAGHLAAMIAVTKRGRRFVDCQ